MVTYITRIDYQNVEPQRTARNIRLDYKKENGHAVGIKFTASRRIHIKIQL
jgi:hypothetical protein